VVKEILVLSIHRADAVLNDSEHLLLQITGGTRSRLLTSAKLVHLAGDLKNNVSFAVVVVEEGKHFDS
jgi:hypothetical protein